MYKKILLALGVLACLFFAGRYFYYGSLLTDCVYTQKEIAIPEKIKDGYFVTVGDSSLLPMEKEYSCLPYFEKSNIDELYAKREASWFSNTSEVFPSGEKLKMVGMVSVTKHGITTIDSGSGPETFYIVEDGRGRQYSLMMPINSSDSFASFFAVSSTTGVPMYSRNSQELLN